MFKDLGVMPVELIGFCARLVFILSGFNVDVVFDDKDSELLEDGVYMDEYTDLAGGGGGALGLLASFSVEMELASSLSDFTLILPLFLDDSDSDSDTSVDEENIFLWAFLNSAMSKSCFSFFSVIYGLFLFASKVSEVSSSFMSTEAAFLARRFISNWSAAAKLPLLPDELDSSEAVDVALGDFIMLVWLTEGPSKSMSLRFPIDLLALRVVVDFPMVLLNNLFSSSKFLRSSLKASASLLNLSCSDMSFRLSFSILSSRINLLSSLFLVFCGVEEKEGGSGGLTTLTLFWFMSKPSSVALETPSLLPDESVLVSPTELLAELS